MADERIGQKQRMRKKIQQSMALDRLIKAFNGEIELTAVQARIGLSLISKILPDLKSVEQSGELNLRHTHEMTDAELADIAARGRSGTAKAQKGKTKPTSVH